MNFPGLGVGVLSWCDRTGRGGLSLRNSLATYQQAGLFELVGEALLWCQEISPQDRALADGMGLAVNGSSDNQGILGGFKNLATAMTSDILVLLENDLPLIEPREELIRQFTLAQDALRSGEVQVFRLRHVAAPGQKFDTLQKYQLYHGLGLMPQLRRTMRPGKAQRLAGTALYGEADPAAKFPDLIAQAADGSYRISSRCLPWTNQSIMVRRDFFLETIIAYAERHPSRRRVNGFPDIEKEWNAPQWRNSGWTIGADRGLFTHERV